MRKLRNTGENMSKTNQEIKQETIQLYDQLSMDLEIRKKQYDIRDKILELNYAFFGYVASHKFINNQYISYEDKLNTAICAWLEMWWKYRWSPKYRSDLSFAVFFKPRITEVMERRLDEVKYSVRRSLCMKVGDQLGKHWAKVTYEDLSNPKLKLSPNNMNALKAIFGSLYSADIEMHQLYIEADKPNMFEYPTDNYDTIHDFLIHEMICEESKLDDAKLKKMADMYCLDFNELKKELPRAECDLYKQLHDSLNIYENM